MMLSDPRQAAHEQDAGRRFVFLLHEALLNPLAVLGEDLEDLVSDVAAATLAPPAQEPTLELLGAALHECVLTAVSSERALAPVGARLTLPKEATHDGQVFRATTLKGVSPGGCCVLLLLNGYIILKE